MSTEKLSAKITSSEALTEIIGPYKPPQCGGVIVNGKTYAATLPWWVVREQSRMKKGIYKQTTLTQALNAIFPWFCVHVSLEDSGQVAYTASTEDGERDKQLRLSPGRLLKRILPHIQDSQVQTLEQHHRAELNGSFFIAKTEQEIAEVYTTMRGDSGCMRAIAQRWGLKHHPSVVYTGPGFGVAYLRDASNAIYARCVIWENPENPKDKRAVRVYGAALLRTKLINAGYEFKPLTGAKLARVLVGTEEDRTFHLPFLDGVDGNQYETQGSHVIDDGQHLCIITGDEAKKHPGSAYARTTTGKVTFPVPPKNVEYVSILTGKSHGSVKSGMHPVYVNGNFGHASTLEVTTAKLMYGIRCFANGRDERVYTKPENIGLGYILDPETIEVKKLKQLHPALYGSNVWSGNWIVDEQNRVLAVYDAVAFLHADGSTTYKRKAEVPARTAGYFKATSLVTKPQAYISKQRPTFRIYGVRTYFDTKYHKEKFQYNYTANAWALIREFRPFHVYQSVFYRHRSQSKNSAVIVPLDDQTIMSITAPLVNAPENEKRVAITLAMQSIWPYEVFARVDGRLAVFYSPSFDQIADAYAQEIATTSENQRNQKRIFELLCRGANVQATV